MSLFGAWGSHTLCGAPPIGTVQFSAMPCGDMALPLGDHLLPDRRDKTLRGKFVNLEVFVGSPGILMVFLIIRIYICTGLLMFD